MRQPAIYVHLLLNIYAVENYSNNFSWHQSHYKIMTNRSRIFIQYSNRIPILGRVGWGQRNQTSDLSLWALLLLLFALSFFLSFLLWAEFIEICIIYLFIHLFIHLINIYQMPTTCRHCARHWRFNSKQPNLVPVGLMGFGV